MHLSMKKTNISIIFILTFFVSCGQFHKLKIEALPMLTEQDTLRNNGEIKIRRLDFFMVDCRSCSDTYIQSQIEKYARSYGDSLKSGYLQYNMYFYRKSEAMNIESILSYPPNMRYKALTHEKLVKGYMWRLGQVTEVKL